MSAKWQSRTKNTPRYAAWAASDAAQSILQHRASPRRAGSPHSGAMPPARQHCRLVFCFPWAHAYIHTHTHTAGNLPSETKPAKQSCKHQIRPSPFHPTPERTFAHGFTSKAATPRWSQLLHELDGAAPSPHGQRSRTLASKEPFIKKPLTCPTNA